jgi:4-amino-4-deoxy-L-arabinose transferase-like glycosyltransferase
MTRFGYPRTSGVGEASQRETGAAPAGGLQVGAGSAVAFPWVAILGTAIVVRLALAFGLLGHMPMVSDAESYDDFAAKLAQDFPGHDAYYWPPGNAFLLAAAYALTGKSVVVARLLMLALSTASVWLVVLLARELSRGNQRVAAAAGWLAALYVPALFLVGQSYAQHLAAFTLLAFTYVGVRALKEDRLAFYAAAGVTLGVGCLTRPSMVSVFPVILVAWWVEGRRRRRAKGMAHAVTGLALFVGFTVAIVAPVQAFNLSRGAGFTISTNNERNLFLGNNPYTPNYKTSQFGQRSLSELDPEVATYLRSYYERPDARDAMRREAIGFAVHHPLVTLYRTVNRTSAFWGFDYLGSRLIQKYEDWPTSRSLPVLALEAGAYSVVALFALAAVFAFRADVDPFWGWMVVCAVLGYEVPYALAFSGGTYHFPVMPLVVVFAAVPLGTCGVREALSRAVQSRGALIAFAVFALIQLQYAYWTFKLAD